MIELSELKELLEYNQETGKFVWKVKRNSCGGKARPGAEAGTPDCKGYWYIGVNGRTYFAHRLAWFYVYGEWPDGEIDHINRDGMDNRIANLRIATSSVNKYNRGISEKNTTGHKGVHLNKVHGRYEAYIKRDGRKYSGGLHTTLEDAIAARKRLEATVWADYAV
jgi:hypothetical protein